MSRRERERKRERDKYFTVERFAVHPGRVGPFKR